MFPKVGDLVKLNPEGSRHPCIQGRVMAFSSGPRCVGNVQDMEDGDFVVCFADATIVIDFIVSSDGAYFREPAGSPSLFLLASSHDQVSRAEPRNNDGRVECFWCHVPTGKRGGGTYDICPKCGR